MNGKGTQGRWEGHAHRAGWKGSKRGESDGDKERERGEEGGRDESTQRIDNFRIFTHLVYIRVPNFCHETNARRTVRIIRRELHVCLQHNESSSSSMYNAHLVGIRAAERCRAGKPTQSTQTRFASLGSKRGLKPVIISVSSISETRAEARARAKNVPRNVRAAWSRVVAAPLSRINVGNVPARLGASDRHENYGP